MILFRQFIVLLLLCSVSCTRIDRQASSSNKDALAGVVLPYVALDETTAQDAVEQIIRKVEESGSSVRMVLSLSSERSPVETDDPFGKSAFMPKTCSGVFTNIPLPQLLDDICKQMGLTWTTRKGSVVITEEGE